MYFSWIFSDLVLKSCYQNLVIFRILNFFFKSANVQRTKTNMQYLLFFFVYSYKRVLLRSAMKVIDDRQQMIINKKKDLLNEITQMVVRWVTFCEILIEKLPKGAKISWNFDQKSVVTEYHFFEILVKKYWNFDFKKCCSF